MKVLVALAVLCLLQTTAGQVSKDGHKLEQHNQVDQGNKHANSHVSANKDQEIHSNHPNKNNKQQAAAQNQHKVQNVALQHGGQIAAQQHVTKQPLKPAVNAQQSSKVTVKIPSKVQQVVGQVSQHVPNVNAQHVANTKQRMVRAVKNHQAWQDLQVNAVDQPGKCEFICSEINLTACGYNGRCYWEFESQCELSTYNCLNTQKIFDVVDSAKCHDEGAPKCYRGDL